jgi:hypothetical protein
VKRRMVIRSPKEPFRAATALETLDENLGPRSLTRSAPGSGARHRPRGRSAGVPGRSGGRRARRGTRCDPVLSRAAGPCPDHGGPRRVHCLLPGRPGYPAGGGDGMPLPVRNGERPGDRTYGRGSDPGHRHLLQPASGRSPLIAAEGVPQRAETCRTARDGTAARVTPCPPGSRAPAGRPGSPPRAPARGSPG